MKTISENIKKAIKAFLQNYMNAMEMSGEALSKGRGCSALKGFPSGASEPTERMLLLLSKYPE